MRTGDSLSQILIDHPEAVSVFEKYDLDYCCQGSDSLESACQSKGISVERIIRDLEAGIASGTAIPQEVQPSRMSVPELIKHIVSTHHHYVAESRPLIDAHLVKICEKHGDLHPELHDVLKLFRELKDDLIFHMYKEEHILFPRIIEVMKALDTQTVKSVFNRRYVESPVGVLKEEHEKVGEILHQLKKITGDFTPPDDACTTYKLAYKELAEFSRDLHLHVHAENNILFPAVIRAQQRQSELKGQ